ncbi:MAG: class I SAM-dependent methyltransferase [Thermodesulfobacteriota bacterium]|nr:class I SAM-dependent methyltransferase [Thermodesulfobacteriota bacterium]
MMEKEGYWSDFADDFEERANYVVGRKDIEAIKAFLSKQKIFGKTLELGCGAGTYSEVLIREAQHLVATDLSDEMVAASKERLKGTENFSVEKADCFSLFYPDSSFDTVFMANLLHVIPEPQKAVAEGKRVLKKNGRLIVISWTTEGLSFFSKLGMIYRYLKCWGKPPPASQRLTVQKTQKILKMCGLRVEEAKLIGNKSKAIFINAIAE